MKSTIQFPFEWFVIAAAVAVAISGGILFYPTPSSGQRQSVEHVVGITDFEFAPATLRVRIGDTVKWINRDLAPHTATAKDESWDTDRLDQGEALSVAVTRGMTTDYYCRFHPMMVAKLQITTVD